MFDPAHPGLLIADILENGDVSIGHTVTELARHLGVTRSALARVVGGKAPVTAELALRLEDALGVRADLWLRMQSKRDLWVAAQVERPTVSRVVPKHVSDQAA